MKDDKNVQQAGIIAETFSMDPLTVLDASPTDYAIRAAAADHVRRMKAKAEEG